MNGLSRADRRRVELAAKTAGNSDCKFTLGAVLVNGGRIVATASNRQRNDPASASYENCTVHAEEAVLKLAKTAAAGATLYVARVGRSGRLLMARPCLRCHHQLVAAGVHKVVYTDQEGNLESIKPTEDNTPEPRKRYEFALVTT